MNKTIQTIIMFALGTAAMFLLFCEPLESSPAWLMELLCSKAAAVLIGISMWRLHRRGGNADAWPKVLTHFFSFHWNRFKI